MMESSLSTLNCGFKDGDSFLGQTNLLLDVSLIKNFDFKNL